MGQASYGICTCRKDPRIRRTRNENMDGTGLLLPSCVDQPPHMVNQFQPVVIYAAWAINGPPKGVTEMVAAAFPAIEPGQSLDKFEIRDHILSASPYV